MNLRAWRAARIVGLAAPLIIVAACNVWFPRGGVGRLRVLVTDKPFPVDMIERAEMTVTRVEVRATTQPSDEDTWVTVFDGEKTLDLLDLRNGQTDLLADATIPAGSYTEMRLIVTNGTLKLLDDDRIFDLRVPSGEQTGIKLKLPFEVPDGGEANLLLDVDLSRAFSAIPSGHTDDPATIRQFRFTPAVAMRLIDILEAGQITGVVTDAVTLLPIENAAVAASKDGALVTSTLSDSDGRYTLMGLPTGTYSVEFSATGYLNHTVNAVAVQAGETTVLDAALSPQEE